MLINSYAHQIEVVPGTRTWMTTGAVGVNVTNGGRSVVKTDRIGAWDVIAYAGVSGTPSNIYNSSGYIEMVINGVGGTQIGLIQSSAAVSAVYLGSAGTSRRIEINAVGDNYTIETGHDGFVSTTPMFSGWSGAVVTCRFDPTSVSIYVDGVGIVGTGWGTTSLGATATYLAIASVETVPLHVRAAAAVQYPIDGVPYLFP